MKLKHANSLCLPVRPKIPVTNGSASVIGGTPLLRRGPGSDPLTRCRSASEAFKVDLGSKSAPVGVPLIPFNVSASEVPFRVSSSSESEEDVEGWLLLKEQAKAWPVKEPDKKVF